jgi:hypothetical protein
MLMPCVDKVPDGYHGGEKKKKKKSPWISYTLVNVPAKNK